MEITWHGQSCFSVKAKDGTVAIDPHAGTGLPESKLKADILLITHNHDDHNNVKAVKGISGKDPFTISGPGEYEFGNITVTGVASSHDGKEIGEGNKNTIYVFKTEDISVCHLGDLGQKSLSDSQLEAVNGVDVLMIPVGGNYTISGKEALDIISQIEPRIVVPMHYKIPGLSIDISDVSEFAKAEGISAETAKDVLKIKAASLPEDERETVILKPKK